ncbi:hypothetical protein DKX38_027092 [Salix brachista]|uniref:MULE transposase domain-containing protein n=1 Tax=Salix brachista TaxID=2182728 RepID=A0A5N5JER9_9ROSI|nr:hypothetical protein DKX38_027092 [Salix brachista]
MWRLGVRMFLISDFVLQKKNITWMIDEPAIEAKDLVNSYVVTLEDEGDECCVVEDAERPMVLDVGNRVDTVNVELFQCLNGRVEEPALGKGFISKDDARDFYNAYAKQTGFSIHVNSYYQSKKDNSISIRLNSYYRSKKDYSIISREFCFSTEGLHREKQAKKMDSGEETRRRRARPIMRFGCQALMTDYDPNNSFSESLSSPGMGLDAPVIVLTEDDETVGKMIFNFLNCINNVGRERLSNFGIDAQNILGFFKIMLASDPAFYHAIQVDEEDRLSRVFWVDTRSRIVYDCFSDVVAFDTTYQANQYKMPFAPYAGVNHHKQSVLFGCALLADETESSFIWLFTTWLEAMLGQPGLIITDYDSAMTRAIESFFPPINPLILLLAHRLQVVGPSQCKRCILCRHEYCLEKWELELGGDGGTTTYEVAKLDEEQKGLATDHNFKVALNTLREARIKISGSKKNAISAQKRETVASNSFQDKNMISSHRDSHSLQTSHAGQKKANTAESCMYNNTFDYVWSNVVPKLKANVVYD